MYSIENSLNLMLEGVSSIDFCKYLWDNNKAGKVVDLC